jgi:competence protein ComEC
MPPARKKLSLTTRWILGILALSVITTFALLLYHSPSNQLQLIFCNVGQGDAAIIQLRHLQLLIDGGPDDRVIGCLDHYLPLGDKTLELVILTHPQADHLNGLIPVFDRYRVQQFATPPVGNTTVGYQELRHQLELHPDTRVINLYAHDQIRLTNQLSALVIWPQASWAAAHLAKVPELDPSQPVLGATTTRNLNDFSQVVHLRYQDFDALFSGDADQNIQDEILAAGLTPSSIEVLKVPHHGSATGLLPEFINQLAPQLAVISVGKNSYGHPSDKILQLLQQKASQVLRTDQQGDIQVITDGHHWWIGD